MTSGEHYRLTKSSKSKCSHPFGLRNPFWRHRPIAAQLQKSLKRRLAIALIVLCIPQTTWGANPITLELVLSLSSEYNTHVHRFFPASWSPNGRYLVGWGGVWHSLVVYDVSSDRLSEAKVLAGHVLAGAKARIVAISWGKNDETLAILANLAGEWRLIIWSIENNAPIQFHILSDGNLPRQCRFTKIQLARPWLLLSNDGGSIWVGCSGPDDAPTYPAAAKLDLGSGAWNTLLLSPKNSAATHSLHTQFSVHSDRELLSLVRGSLMTSYDVDTSLAILDVRSGGDREIPLKIATPRSHVGCIIPHMEPNDSGITFFYSTIREERPVEAPSRQSDADYDYRVGTIKLDRMEYTFRRDFQGHVDCQRVVFVSDKSNVIYISRHDKGVYFLDMSTGLVARALPEGDAISVSLTRDGKRLAVHRGGYRNNSRWTEIALYDVE